MFGGKSQNTIKPTALGVMLQASTYGATIPTIYGRMKSSLLMTWLQNLRKGSSGKKGKKAGKKGTPPSYVANCDLLIANNPILGVLQAWNNNEPRYELNFDVQTFTADYTRSTYAVTDADFYAVIAVTLEVPYDVTFNDYGSAGSRHLTGNYEIPLFNGYTLGPDPSQPPSSRFYPYTYRWNPNAGPSIYLEGFDSGLFGLLNGATLRIYYAKKQSNNDTPLARLRLTFEPQLGDGSEYSGFTDQQIIYPMFAGCGSPDLDLGGSATAPKINLEIQGKFGVYPSGDADFVDIIDDIIKSGLLQAGYTSDQSVTKSQHGVNCYDYPMVVQARVASAFEDAFGLGVKPLVLGSPLNAGDIVLVADFGRDGDGSTFAAPADTAANTYSLIKRGNVIGPGTNGWPYGLFYASVAVDEAAGDILTSNNSNYSHQVMLAVLRGDALEFDNSATFEYSAWDGPLSPIPSIRTTQDSNHDAVIVAWVGTYSGAVAAPSGTSTDWKPLFSGFAQQQNSFMLIRRVSQPGTYTIEGLIASGTTNVTVVLAAFKSTEPRSVAKSLGNIMDDASLALCRQQCRAYGLFGSLAMSSQKAASDWINDLCEASLIAPFWSGFRLKFFPYGEISAVGNGATYVSPTAAGPLATINSKNGLISADPQTPPVTIERTKQTDLPNIIQYQIPNRSTDYNQVVIKQPLAGATSQHGPRLDDLKTLDMVTTVGVARKLAVAKGKRMLLMDPITIKGKLRANWQMLEVGDMVLLDEPLCGMNLQPIRFKSLTQNADDEIEFEAYKFVYGANYPDDLPATDPIGSGGDRDVDPGSVNPPIIFQPVPRLLEKQSQPQVWLVVSGESEHYGGCVVLISTNGGASYTAIGSLQGSAVTGYLSADWAASDDPDTTNDLSVNVAESRGEIESLSAIDEDNFVLPFYVDGGEGPIIYAVDGTDVAQMASYAVDGTDVAEPVTIYAVDGVDVAGNDGIAPAIQYELGAYAHADLISADNYTLRATSGYHLRRAVFGAPFPGQGVDHPLGSRFCLLDPLGVGIEKLDLDAKWIDKQLFFKFLAFNEFGGKLQAESDAVAYSFTPQRQGISQSYAQTPAVALSQPTSSPMVYEVDMAQVTEEFSGNRANYNARTFSISDPGGSPATYYVTIYDPAYTGEAIGAPVLDSFCETNNSKVGVAGYIYIGSITVTHAGGVTGTPGGWPQ